MRVKPEVERYLSDSLLRLDAYVRGQDYKGFDPYDVLASRLPLKKLGTRTCYYLTQLNKRDPSGLIRAALLVPKQFVPKALALFIQSYSNWPKAGLEDRTGQTRYLLDALEALRSPGYDDKYCWGLNYPYATSLKYVAALEPSLVVTAYAHRAYETLYQHLPDQRILKIMESGIRFLLEDLPKTEEQETVCFSYYPSQKDIVYNANAKAAEMLARMFVLTGKPQYRDLAYKSMDFTLHHQHPDGRWNYRRHDDGTERAQIDFHQLDIVESLHRFTNLLSPESDRYAKAMHAGLDFFRQHQLKADGTVYYRWPKYWPIDTHNQASAIITFAHLSDQRPELLEHALNIAQVTIDQMQTPSGGFAYQKGRVLNNRMHYIRWSDAWMHLALSTLLEKIKNPCAE